MRRIRWTALALAGVLGACTESLTAPQPIRALPRSLSVAEQQVIAGSNSFAFGLLREAPARGGNVFVSPLSVSMALGMTMNGARGDTRTEMAATIGFGGMAPDDVNASYRSLVDLLRGLDRTTDMRLANSVWYRQGFPIDASFLDQTRASFDAQVAALDFADPAAKDRINAWVKQGTGGKITRIVDEITSDDVMFLVNAVYFKGRWVKPFDRSATRDETFHRSGASPVTVRMMTSAEGTFGYARGTGWQAVDLPYGNGAFTMTVVLPDSGVGTAALAAGMDAAAWSALTGSLHPTGISVRLPRFRLEYSGDLVDPLDRLGIHRAFGAGADFTGMSASRGHELFVSEVKHKTFVDVNEEGTEAAAATSVGVGVTSLPPTITVNRPFLVAIRERFSGTILFLGRIEDPTAT
jgi:serine protease inhibitor